jgi:ornithine cyclodeaminase/alanine dehydrogenase-like protein (mu-crystallin family)
MVIFVLLHSFIQRNVLEGKWLATITDMSREHRALSDCDVVVTVAALHHTAVNSELHNKHVSVLQRKCI